ncbi:MAG: hypothetical protein SVK08_02945 [Halobacteriota archaeon]|nr:hypothetical protein [Halobacteriota archaeon]
MKPISGLQEFLDEYEMTRQEFEQMTGECAENYEGLTFWQIHAEVFADAIAANNQLMEMGL